MMKRARWLYYCNNKNDNGIVYWESDITEGLLVAQLVNLITLIKLKLYFHKVKVIQKHVKKVN